MSSPSLGPLLRVLKTILPVTVLSAGLLPVICPQKLSCCGECHPVKVAAKGFWDGVSFSYLLQN